MHYIKGQGWKEASGKPVCNHRTMQLHLARIAGHNNDSSTYTRLLCERRGVSYQAMQDAWYQGVGMRKAGQPQPA